ncbi:MAG: ABC transporter substrate-binding protein [Beijerinckiaceae bacterium]|nr:ABC transporter substrate-binding protein [Beijerinckiaceae bacterium]
MAKPVTIAQARVVLDDPHACTDSGDVLTVFGALFDTLVKRNDQGRYAPSLATGWTLSPDARTFTFRLREGVRFHNGDAFDSAAVKYSLERMARPDMGATLGAPGVYAQYLAGLEVTCDGPHSVTVTLAEPMADLFDVLVAGNIVSPRAIEAAGDDLAARAIGTGPYRLEGFVANEEIRLAAVPGHFDGPVANAALRYIRGATPAARLALAQDGSADIANGLETAEQQALAGGAGFTTIDYLAPTAIIFMFNATHGPGSDARVRRALNLGIDREALVRDVLHGAGQPLHGFVSPVHYGADRNSPGFMQDKAEARRLLTEAGHADGVTFNVYCPTRLPDEAQALVKAVEMQLADLGVRFAVHLEADRTHYANQVRLKQIHDLCVFDSSPMSTFRVLHEKVDSRVRGSWWEGYANPAVEALIDRARRTVDDEARESLFRECYRLLQADPPWLYLYNHRRGVALRGSHPRWAMRRDGILDVRCLPALG